MYKSRCLVRVWCADHPSELVAAVMATDLGPTLVLSNLNTAVPWGRAEHLRQAYGDGVTAWVPEPTLMSEPQPTLHCNRCRKPRNAVTNLDELVGAAQKSHAGKVSVST